MIEISAQENATIDVIKGNFPLGNRDTLLLHIKDPIIKNLISLRETGICEDKDNYYTYGQFNSTNNLILEDLQPGAKVEIVPGKGLNYSNCLHCTTTKYGLGYIYMVPSDDKELTVGTKYVLTCYLNVVSGTVKLTASSASVVKTIFSVDQQNTENEWVQIRQEFTAEGEDFSLFITMDGVGEFYMDSLMLFKADNEIKIPKENIAAEISIINPYTPINSKINKVINWYKTENEVQILFYFPEVTNVDYQNNIWCCARIFQHLPEKVSTLGNIVYHDVDTVIYETEPFVLNGYIIPTDINFEVDAELVVPRI